MELGAFKYKTPDFARLKNFGFELQNGAYVYKTDILDGQFDFCVKIDCCGKVDTLLTDKLTGEPYTLHLIDGASGSFVGSVRAEVDSVLLNISEKCFYRDVFKGEVAKMVIEYVRQTYGDELEFLWEKLPDAAVWRRKDSKKWYGILMTVSGRKLGLKSDSPVHIIDLRAKPEEMEGLLDGIKYFPGYHMNKRHWFTLCLDGSVPPEEICLRIDDSYALAKK